MCMKLRNKEREKHKHAVRECNVLVDNYNELHNKCKKEKKISEQRKVRRN